MEITNKTVTYETSTGKVLVNGKEDSNYKPCFIPGKSDPVLIGFAISGKVYKLDGTVLQLHAEDGISI